MNIERIDKKRLKIHLSGQDMKDFSAEFKTLDYKNSETRQLVSDLLNLAKIKTGFDSKNKRMAIEAFQTSDLGCVLYFTLLSNVDKAKKTKYFIYEFDDFEHLLAVKKDIKTTASALYMLGDKYILVIKSEESENTVDMRLLHLLEQYAVKRKDSSAYRIYLSEYGKLLIDEDALCTLDKYFT